MTSLSQRSGQLVVHRPRHLRLFCL